MSQSNWNREAIDMLPLTKEYIHSNVASPWRASHHRAVVIQMVNNTSTPIASMKEDTLKKFDEIVLSQLKHLDEIK